MPIALNKLQHTALAKCRSILILAKGFPPVPGGVESYSKSIADAYSKLGHDVRVAAAFPDCNIAPPQDCRYPLDIISGKSQASLMAQFVHHLRKLKKSEAPPNLIHASTWRMALPAIIAFPATPIVISCHGNEILVRGPIRHLMHWTLRRACRIICVSLYTKNLLLRQFPPLNSKVVVAYNGIGFHPEATAVNEKWLTEPSKLRIFTVCRHEKRKNLIAAVEAIGKLDSQLEYLIAGTGPLSTTLLNTIDSLNVGNKVRLLGRVSDSHLEALYSTSHIFLHPQIELLEAGDVEGFGLVVADSMAHACVPVVGNNGGTAELVNDKRTGITLQTCSADEIASRLQLLLANFPEMKSLATAAKMHSDEHFSWEKHTTRALLGLDRE